MHRVAEQAVASEKLLGLDSSLHNPQIVSDWDGTEDADVHVVHAHFPEQMKKRVTRPLKIAWVAHGTPDHVFFSSLEAGVNTSYGHSDSLQMMQHWIKDADARITFWPRHKWIYDQMIQKGTKIHLVPLGVDKAFWQASETKGKFAGAPSVFTAENPHNIKHPYDLFIAWPEVAKECDSATLHAAYVARDQHRWIFPLVNSNGTAYRAYLTPITFDPDGLRNVFKSVDFFCGLVRYGDFNHLSLQASAAGAKTISYAGNPYSDFWITEGDQRAMAKDIIKILKGEVEPRAKDAVPDLADTALAMKEIYEGIV